MRTALAAAVVACAVPALLVVATGAPSLASPRRAVAAGSQPAQRAVADRAAGDRAMTVPACTSSDLDVWIDTKGSGVAGGVYYLLEFTNLSNHACALYGFPGVSAVGPSGHQIGSAALRDTAQASTTITLAPAKAMGSIVTGATASAALKITDVSVFPAARCEAVVAAGLRVYPPDQTASKIVPFPFPACSRAGTSYLQIESVAKSAPLD